jgi:hypothetical protein
VLQDARAGSSAGLRRALFYRACFSGRGEMVDARDLKSLGEKSLCRFESGRPHQYKPIRKLDQ